MNSTASILYDRSRLLQKLIHEKETALQSSPSGSLKIHHKNGQAYYYHAEPSVKKPVYLDKRKYDLACDLAQKSYDKHVLTSAKKELNAIKSALSALPNVCAEEVFPLLSSDRQKMVTPIVLPASALKEKWLQTPYSPKPFLEDTSEFYTDNKERVRSKSEILIANTLKKMDIPYKYECPLTLKNGSIIYPDFTLLDVIGRRLLYLEHLGMMDDSSYSETAVDRILQYEQNGIYPGDTLLLSYETRRHPLNIKHLVEKLNYYLKL